MRKESILVGLSLLLLPAISQAKTLEELLVEKGVITQNEVRGSSHGGGNVYWNDGSRLDFPDTGFTTKIATTLQTRYEFADNDERDNHSSFEVHLARLAISGKAVNNEFSYMMEGDFTSDESRGSANLTDGWLAWHAMENGHIKMGQFKTAVSRQWNAHEHELQFADRSLVSGEFDQGRQQGAEWGWWKGNWGLAAQVFNGQSTGEGQNSVGVDTKHTGVVSFRADVVGEMDAYAEGDVEWSDNPNVNIGAAYSYAEDEIAEVGTLETHTISVDANYKQKGLSVHGEIYVGNSEVEDSDAEEEPVGFYAQVGYFIQPKKMEIAARYGYLDCDDEGACDTPGDAGTDEVQEATIGLNYYWWGHHLKSQINYAYVQYADAAGDGDDLGDNRWLVQLAGHF